jgi:hypothetical protein
MTRISFLFVLLLCFTVSQAWADRVYVDNATGSGVSDSDLDTARDLVKGAVPQVSSNTLVDSPDSADFSLRPNLVRLGKAYVMELEKAGRDGNVIFSSSLKAQKMDELDKVAVRLTRSVLQNRQATQDKHVGEITDEEAHNGTQRTPVRKFWELGFGGAEFNNLNVSGIGYDFDLAYGWDVNTALIKLMADFGGLDSAFILSAGIGGDIFLSTGETAPYVAGDFGFGAAKAEGGSGFFSGSTNGGFDAGVGAGVMFMRTSSVNLDLGFRAGFLLKSNSYGSPQIYSLRIGVLF